MIYADIRPYVGREHLNSFTRQLFFYYFFILEQILLRLRLRILSRMRALRRWIYIIYGGLRIELFRAIYCPIMYLITPTW